MNEFEASNYLVRKAKKVVEERGILSSPNPKAGKNLSKTTVTQVKEFYYCENISRLMPGMKDFVSVMIDGKRQHIQKRLVLCNLKEAYEEFKQKYPNHKVGFSKFADLRPKECVLAGASGTHSVCVCTIHQNFKLMFQGAKLETLENEYTYHDCLSETQCNPASVQCFSGECTECPGVEKLHEKIEKYFDEQTIDRIEYKQWTTTDRANLETKVQSADEFLHSFTSSIPKVLQHDFIAKQQARFLQETKRTLKLGEFLVVGDFAENYSFIVQDAAQSFHWNNLQATLHPFVCYYIEIDEKNREPLLMHTSFVIISENNNHDTIAVHLFQKSLINFLRNKIKEPTNIIYFSDGCAAQYKNRKNFVNLCHHNEDFGMPAEWHFFATSHGKGPCDGVGGTVKRLAARASLQRPVNNQITTPRQLFEFAELEIKTVNFYYATINEYEAESKFLAGRFESTRTIAGTHRLHCFKPISKWMLEVGDFSSDANKRQEKIVVDDPVNLINFASITGYVTAVYDGFWWVACVVKTFPESEETEVSFLHPHGPSRSFRYPSPKDVLIMSCKDVLTTINPTTATGRTYTLSLEEMATATRALIDHQKKTLK